MDKKNTRARITKEDANQTKASQIHAIADVTAAELSARVLTVDKHLDAVGTLLADAVQLSEAQRKNALRVQGEGEAAALNGVLDFVDKRPELFVDLADSDAGVDASRFETELLRDRLVNAETMTSLAARFTALASLCQDSAAYLGTLSKGPTLLAYEIAKPYQVRDVVNGKLLTPAVNLYRARAIRAAKSRLHNAAEAKASASAPPMTAATATVTTMTDASEPEK